jgi:O-antigen ligase
MPFGSGFGTFDPVYRIHEPYDRLDQQYLNHAHNDLVELALTAGVPGLVLVGAFLVWFARRCWILNRESRPTPALAPALAGAAVLGILLLASLADYPLRTPLMMMVGAIAAVWTNNASSRG